MTDAAPAIRSALLQCEGVTHAFFTREGGVSEGLYASLNGGAGSRDAPGSVTENKRRARVYAITRAGRKQVAAETERWNSLASGVARILRHA